MLPVGVAPLVPKPRLDPVVRAFEPLEPGLAPPVAVEPRIRRARVPDEHRGGPVEHVERLDASAAVVDVVGVAVVRRHQRHDRLEPGRASAASWSALKPPHEIPHMPRLPSHHGCSRSQAITSRQSACSCSVYSSVMSPSDSAGAAHVDPHRRVAEARDVGLPARVADRRPVHLAVRGGTRGSRGPDPPRHPPAARSAPRAGSRRRGSARCVRSPGSRAETRSGRHRPDPLMRRDRIAR